MSQIGREIQLTLQAAVREAQVRRHAYLTVEHLLYALVHDDHGVEILRNCGARVRRLRVQLHDFLDTAIKQSREMSRSRPPRPWPSTG